MGIGLVPVLMVATLTGFAVYSLYKFDKRRWDRRRGRLFAPIQRRKQGRRRTGLPAHFIWAMRTQLARFAKPKEQPKPRRRPR
jgi:hypothetical protein